MSAKITSQHLCYMHPCLLVLHCSSFELQQRPAAGPATLTQQFLHSAGRLFPALRSPAHKPARCNATRMVKDFTKTALWHGAR